MVLKFEKLFYKNPCVHFFIIWIHNAMDFLHTTNTTLSYLTLRVDNCGEQLLSELRTDLERKDDFVKQMHS